MPVEMPNRSSQGGINSAFESVKLPKDEIGAGAEISLELAGQNREFIAQLVERILKEEFKNFGLESEELVGATMEAIQEIGFGPDTDLTLIVREVQSRTMPFTQEAAELFERTLKRAQEILNSSSTIAANNPSSNFPGFGPTPTPIPTPTPTSTSTSTSTSTPDIDRTPTSTSTSTPTPTSTSTPTPELPTPTSTPDIDRTPTPTSSGPTSLNY